MRERTDQKLREVAVAWYAFRHEAEFAAGFLDDAGIPYRMQVDDPVLGSGVTSHATLWVLGMHERQAREVLELDGEPAYLTGGSSHRASSRSAAARPDAQRARPPRPSRRPSDASVYAGDGGTGRPVSALSHRERGLALLLGGGGLALLRPFLAGGMHPIVSGGVGVLGAVLVLAGITGWAPAPLRRLLRAVSGSAP